MEYIALDVHKRYTWARVETAQGERVSEQRVGHQRGAIQQFVQQWATGSPVAVETVGNWYWVIDEIEAGGGQPQLVNARLAKLMMGSVNKSDRLDVQGLNRLQRTGTLPTVWIPSGAMRDARELPRTRMVFSRHRTQLKNRVLATLAKYGLLVEDVSDAFGGGGRQQIADLVPQLPPQTQQAVTALLGQLDHVLATLTLVERQMRTVFAPCPETAWLKTLPGVGELLAIVIWTEVGTVARFGRAEALASYSGLVPREHSSGGKIRFGAIRRDVNQYLKWAFVEAANSALLNRQRCGYTHLSQLYERVRARRGHGKAKVAVARHLAEASFWMLTKGEPYRAPRSSTPR
jgi:transposase